MRENDNRRQYIPGGMACMCGTVLIALDDRTPTKITTTTGSFESVNYQPSDGSPRSTKRHIKEESCDDVEPYNEEGSIPKYKDDNEKRFRRKCKRSSNIYNSVYYLSDRWQYRYKYKNTYILCQHVYFG